MFLLKSCHICPRGSNHVCISIDTTHLWLSGNSLCVSVVPLLIHTYRKEMESGCDWKGPLGYAAPYNVHHETLLS
jgi:hypothetical protein